MTARARPHSHLALWLGAAAALLIVASFPLSSLAHQLTFGGVGQLLLMIPFAAVGALVASRQPRNPIGWLLLAIAVTASLRRRRRLLRSPCLPHRSSRAFLSRGSLSS